MFCTQDLFPEDQRDFFRDWARQFAIAIRCAGGTKELQRDGWQIFQTRMRIAYNVTFPLAMRLDEKREEWLARLDARDQVRVYILSFIILA